MIGNNLCGSKNDYESGSVFYGLFLAPIIKFVLTITELCIIKQHLIFKGFNDSKRLLDRSQNFKVLEGKTIAAMLPRSSKKSFSNGVVIPTKMRRCNKCSDKILCEECKNQVNENKKFEANSNLLKRKASNEFGHMIPYFVE